MFLEFVMHFGKTKGKNLVDKSIIIPNKEFHGFVVNFFSFTIDCSQNAFIIFKHMMVIM